MESLPMWPNRSDGGAKMKPSFYYCAILLASRGCTIHSRLVTLTRTTRVLIISFVSHEISLAFKSCTFTSSCCFFKTARWYIFYNYSADFNSGFSANLSEFLLWLTSVLTFIHQITCEQSYKMVRQRKALTMDSLNPNVKAMEYAVRGPILQKAKKVEQELEEVRLYTRPIIVVCIQCVYSPFHHIRVSRNRSHKWLEQTSATATLLGRLL